MTKLVIVLFSFIFFAADSMAEYTKVFGDYDVHYNVLNSTFISPEVAKAYGIVRGKNRALINIAVRRRLDKGVTTAKKAIVNGNSSDLIHTEHIA